MHGQSASDLRSRLSIFYKLSAENLRDPSSYHVLNNSFESSVSSENPFPVTSCSWINDDLEAYFVLTGSFGNIYVIKMCQQGRLGNLF